MPAILDGLDSPTICFFQVRKPFDGAVQVAGRGSEIVRSKAHGTSILSGHRFPDPLVPTLPSTLAYSSAHHNHCRSRLVGKPEIMGGESSLPELLPIGPLHVNRERDQESWWHNMVLAPAPPGRTV